VWGQKKKKTDEGRRRERGRKKVFTILLERELKKGGVKGK